MTITIAKHAGFCFGVKRATGELEREIAEREPGRRILTLGRIIHNDNYTKKIAALGVSEISREDIPATVAAADRGEKISLVIRAHGELASVIDELAACAERNPDFRLLDCTCPYVRKVREIARENSGDESIFILSGDGNHPEVEGIMSCADGEKYSFSTADELEKFVESGDAHNFCAKSIVIASQTTQNLDEWKKTIKFIKKVYTNALIFDTICNVTQLRQEEAKILAARSDAVIVIGSSESSNSRKLCEVSAELCPKVYFVGDPSECLKIDARNINNLSITAGASTPDSLIQEVYKTMNEQMENFAELLESSLKTLNTGDIVEGVITSISQNEIHLDLGAKTTGVIVHDKATDDPQAKLDRLYKVGDIIKAKVVKVSDIDGIATLDKTRVDSEANWEKIVAAFESGETLEGKIVEVVRGGVIISLYSVRVFIPASLTGVPKEVDLQTIMNTTQKVKIVEIKADRKRAYASIRAVLREERKAQEEAFWNEIAEGKEYDGTIKSLTSFGAFVDLGGVDGMVHTTELSWRRIKHPSEVVAVGDNIHVYVKSFDREKGRISLGYKTDEMNPWTIFTGKYAEGDTAEVKIVSLMPFGAFAEIVPGCDGLIHISQIADRKIAKPEDVLEVGQVVEAKITAIDEEKHKVSLSIRALLEPEVEDEAEAVEAVEEAEATEADAE